MRMTPILRSYEFFETIGISTASLRRVPPIYGMEFTIYSSSGDTPLTEPPLDFRDSGPRRVQGPVRNKD